MGHYDSCYEADARDEAKERHKEIKKELKELLEKLDDDEKELLILIIENFKDFKATFKFIKKMTK